MAAVAETPISPSLRRAPSPGAASGAPERDHAGALQPQEAFFRVLNWRTVALTFYFCVIVVLGRSLGDFYADSLLEWLSSSIRYLRQSLISGLFILFAIALADAVAVNFRWGRMRALWFGGLAVATGATLAMMVRYWTYGTPLSNVSREWSYSAGIIALWTLIGTLAYALFYLTREDDEQLRELNDAECRAQALSAQMLQARLSALQAQIEPHFLFNTLANVKRLYETHPSRGREMLASLIDYFRAALPSMRETGSTLGRELELARSFLTILQMRMGDRLAFSIRADDALLDAEMPPMLLPTLVENAIKHGLAPLPEGGHIDIQAARDDGHLRLTVRDSGAGIRASSGSGVGLANTRSRLAALYGGQASLELQSATPRGVVAILRLPLTRSARLSSEELCA